MNQYTAVSYGDKLFSQYILLPIQQNQSPILRRLFWLDHTHVTRIITLVPNEVCYRTILLCTPILLYLTLQVSIPINSFLYPIELEWDLVEQYFRLLVSDALT